MLAVRLRGKEGSRTIEVKYKENDRKRVDNECDEEVDDALSEEKLPE